MMSSLYIFMGELYCLLAILALPTWIQLNGSLNPLGAGHRGEALVLLAGQPPCSVQHLGKKTADIWKMGLMHLLRVGLGLLRLCLLGLGEGRVEAGHYLVPPLDHQGQLVPGLLDEAERLVVVQVEDVLACSAERQIPYTLVNTGKVATTSISSHRVTLSVLTEMWGLNALRQPRA